MSTPADPVRVSIRLNVASAATAAVLAVFSIFNRIEDPEVGLAVWGGFLVIVGTAHTSVLIASGRPSGWWSWWVGHSLTAVLIGAFTLWFVPSGSIALLTWSIVVWSVVSGGASVVQGFRQDRTLSIRSDWISLGAGTLFFGLLVLIVPPEVYWLLGLAGVWAAMVTVFLVIAALSARPGVTGQNGAGEDDQ